VEVGGASWFEARDAGWPRASRDGARVGAVDASESDAAEAGPLCSARWPTASGVGPSSRLDGAFSWQRDAAPYGG